MCDLNSKRYTEKLESIIPLISPIKQKASDFIFLSNVEHERWRDSDIAHCDWLALVCSDSGLEYLRCAREIILKIILRYEVAELIFTFKS